MAETQRVELCLPEWLYKMWFFEYGGERTAAMARSFLKEGATTVRVKPEKIEEAMESLKKQGVTVKEEPLFPGILYLKNYDYLESLDAFQNGWLQVQDLSSALVGKLAPPQKGSLVLDVCAAPGGKSFALGLSMKNQGPSDTRLFFILPDAGSE